MIYFLVGPMGIGKNYMGKQLAAQMGCKFIDGDEFIPSKIAKKIMSIKLLSLEDLDNFVAKHLIPEIEKRSQTDLVVAQALYRKRHRDLIRKHFGEDCVFIQISKIVFTDKSKTIA